MKKQLNNKELLERNKILTRKLRDSIKYYSQRINNLEKEIKRLKNLIQKMDGDSSKTDSAFTKTIVCGTAGIKRRSALR